MLKRWIRVSLFAALVAATASVFPSEATAQDSPVLDRIVEPSMSLSEAARCALISFDSTMRSNISVGPPIDLFCYRRDGHGQTFRRRFEEDDPYWERIRAAWGEGLKRAFAELPEPSWEI